MVQAGTRKWLGMSVPGADTAKSCLLVPAVFCSPMRRVLIGRRVFRLSDNGGGSGRNHGGDIQPPGPAVPGRLTSHLPRSVFLGAIFFLESRRDRERAEVDNCPFFIFAFTFTLTDSPLFIPVPQPPRHFRHPLRHDAGIHRPFMTA